MYIYFAILILVFSFYLFFLYNHKKSNMRKRLFLFCSFFCLTLVLGLRGVDVGEDTRHYSIELFEIFKGISWKQVLTSPTGTIWSVWGEKIEFLFAVLYKVVQAFGGNGQTFIFVVAALTCGLFARFIYVNIPDNVFFATIIFICDSLFMGSFNGIRQMLSLSVAINSYDSMEKENYKKAILIYFIAFLIHKSSIVVALLLLLFLVKDKRLGVIYTFIGAVALSIGMPLVARVVSQIFPRYSSYFSNNYWSNRLNGVLILWAVIILISTYIFIKGIKNNREYFGIIGTILYIAIEIIGLRIAAFTRIEYFFKAFLMMLFPACSEKFKKSSRKIYYAFIFLLIFAEYISYARTGYRKYSFFWE